MNSPPMIDVRALRRTFGAVVALDGVTFEIPRGAVVGFLGPNGAGKTTTMKILTGTLAASSGSAFVAGLDVSRPTAFRARLGYLPENAPVPPELPVEGYLRFVARVRGLARARVNTAVSQVIERTGLGDMRRRVLGTLSKGYRQRVGLAQAIVHDPEVLILDEPTTGLDPNQVLHMRALIRTLGRDKTVLLSSHVLEEVTAVADRVLILDRGRLVADGTPAALGARMTGVAIRVVVTAPAVGLAEVLGAVPGVGSVQIEAEGAQVVAHLEAAPTVRPAVAAALVGAGYGLLAMDEARADLGSVFRHLTGGGAP